MIVKKGANGKPITKRTNLNETLYAVNTNKHWITKAEIIEATRSYSVANARICGSGISIIDIHTRIEKISKNNIDKLYKFICYTYRKNEYGYDENYLFEDFIESYNKSVHNTLEKYRGYITFFGNQIVCWFSIKSNFGLSIMNCLYRDLDLDGLGMTFNMLSNKNKNLILAEHGYSYSSNRFKSLSCRSNIDNDYRYNFGSTIYLTLGDTEQLVKYIENKFFIRKVDFSKIKLMAVSDSDISNIWQKTYYNSIFEGYWTNSCNNYASVGFHYFKFNEHSRNAKYIIAVQDGLIVGVIKLGIHEDHQVIAYIDILRTCRNQGVATYMIKQLNKYLCQGLPLIITDESEMGKMCHIADKFKANVKSVKVKTYEEALRDRRYD